MTKALQVPMSALVDDIGQNSFDSFFIRKFIAHRGDEFSAFWIHAIANEFIQGFAAELTNDRVGVGFQVPVANSIAIFVVVPGRSLPKFEVLHSFGGLSFTPAKQHARFLIEGYSVACFMQMCLVETRPSVVRVHPEVALLNDMFIWTDSYIFRTLSTRLGTIPSDTQVYAPPPRHAEEVIRQKVVVGVPVHNAPDHFVPFFRSLEHSVANVLGEGKGEVSIVVTDDASDAYSEQRLAESLRRLKEAMKPGITVEMRRNDENRGFIATSNAMFDAARYADIFVLLTTDIKLPHGWLSRLLAPFLEMDNVALATPFATNGANLSIPLSPGQSWRDLDAMVQLRSPQFPDAETTVGYCLAVRCASLDKQDLFSSHFKNGYGDDSDLYYRLVALGFRGVAVDNMVIHHAGGGSFDNLDNAAMLRSSNGARFAEDWMQTYLRRIQPAITTIQRTVKKMTQTRGPARRLSEILFLLPTVDRSIGGIEAVFRLTERLQERGTAAHILSLGGRSMSKIVGEYQAVDIEDPARSVDACLETVSTPRIIVATSFDTVPYVKALQRACGCKIWYFVQGPEMAFSAGAFSPTVVEGYKNFDKVMCVSQYLIDLVKSISGISASLVPFGPDPDEFYPGVSATREGVALQYAGRADKGSDLMGIIVPSLLAAGFSVTAFGLPSAYFELDHRVQHIGFASGKTLRRLFQRMEYYVDVSRFEGLGMLPLEALYCGAVPVIADNGGSAYEIIRAQAGILTGTLSSLHNIGTHLAQARQDRSAYTAGREVVMCKHNIDAAVEALRGHIAQNG